MSRIRIPVVHPLKEPFFTAVQSVTSALSASSQGRYRTTVEYFLRYLGQYHAGVESLDQLRRAGWKGHGPVPWEHQPNRGFLRSLHALGQAAAAIGEDDEARRCEQFLQDSSPAAAVELSD